MAAVGALEVPGCTQHPAAPVGEKSVCKHPDPCEVMCEGKWSMCFLSTRRALVGECSEPFAFHGDQMDVAEPAIDPPLHLGTPRAQPLLVPIRRGGGDNSRWREVGGEG